MIFSSRSIVFRRFPALHDSALFQKETRTKHRVARRGLCIATRSSFVARSKANRRAIQSPLLARFKAVSREIGADPRNRANRREVWSVQPRSEAVMSRDEADLSRSRTSSRVTGNVPRNSQGLQAEASAARLSVAKV